MGRAVITLGQAVGLVASGLAGYPQTILERAAEELDRLAAAEELAAKLVVQLREMEGGPAGWVDEVTLKDLEGAIREGPRGWMLRRSD